MRAARTVAPAAVLWAAAGAGVPAVAHAAPLQGGVVTWLVAGDVDTLDPGKTATPLGRAVAGAVFRRPYRVTLDETGEQALAPDLASGPPEVAPDGLTVTIRLRAGVHYAPPVSREVVAGDVKFALERAFTRTVGGPDARAWFGALAGVPRASRGYRPIAGIEVPDPRTLVLRFTKPVAATAVRALALPVAAPVPADVGSPVATGPYLVASHHPGRSLRLARNPSFDPATDIGPAPLDGVAILVRSGGLPAAARAALNGRATICCDAAAPAATVGRARDERPGQVVVAPAQSTRTVTLNTRSASLRNRNVRRGILAALDRVRLRATQGGAAAGDVATHFLAPADPAFGHAGGAGGAKVPFLAAPEGNRVLAARYLRRGGLGDRGRRRRVALDIAGAPAATAREVARQLRSLGFRTRVRPAAGCDAGIDVCLTSVAPSLPDPEAALRPAFDGTRIGAARTNASRLDVASVNRAMAAAAALPAGDARLAEWAAIDRRIVAQAPAAPYLWPAASSVQSADVDGVVDPLTGLWDIPRTGLKAAP